MYLSSKPDNQGEKILAGMRIAAQLLSQYWINDDAKQIVIPAQKSLYSCCPRDGSIYGINEGVLKCLKNDKIVFYMEERDIIGFEGSSFDEEMDYYAEFAVVLTKLDPKILTQSDDAVRLWNKLQGGFLNVILQSVSQHTKSDSIFTPEVRIFTPGEYIVEQGTVGTEVFSLIDGIGQTVVDGKVVNEVLPDQFFGAVSSLTSSSRIASVRALTECMVVVFSKEEFISLIRSKPDTMVKLAEDLSRAIVELNLEVNGLVKIV